MFWFSSIFSFILFSLSTCRVQKGNLHLHPITCLRTGSWSVLACGYRPLPVFLLFFFFMLSGILFLFVFRFYFVILCVFIFLPVLWSLPRRGVIGRNSLLAGMALCFQFTWCFLNRLCLFTYASISSPPKVSAKNLSNCVPFGDSVFQSILDQTPSGTWLKVLILESFSSPSVVLSLLFSRLLLQ